MRIIFLAATASALLLAGSAAAQTTAAPATPDTSAAPAAPATTAVPADPAAPAVAPDPAAAPANGYNVAPAAATGDLAQAKAGDANVVSNGPVPDTPDNRAKYGKPDSHAGKRTQPAGN